MKKSLLALAALSAVAGAASAQVTLSGGVDLGVQSKNDNKTVATAGAPRSNLTFSGMEDMGGDMSAYFLLNMRFKPENGQTNPGANASSPTPTPAGGTAPAAGTTNTAPDNQLFRNSYVGLTHKAAGSVQMGRFLAPLQENDAKYDAFGTDTVGSVNVSTANVTGSNNKSNARLNSAIEYRSPVLAGVQLLVAAADTNAQGVTSPSKRPLGVSISLNQGPVSLALAADRTAFDLKTNGLYGKFTLPNKAALMFQYEKGDFNSAKTQKIKSYSLSTKVPVGMVDIKAGYLNTKTDITGAKAMKKIGLGADYNLSKRTQLYVDLGKYSGGNGQTAADLTSVQKKTQYDIGIYHKF